MTAAIVDVRLVLLGNATPAEFAAQLHSLSDDERARARTYTQPRDAVAFATTRALLRRLIAERMGGNPADVRFAYDERGRPHLGRDAPLRFSVSHSAPYAVIAIADGHSVGIDIEGWKPITIADMGAGVFTPEEVERIRAAPDLVKSLYDHWTRKEAVLKLRGTGLGGSPDSLLTTPGEPQWFGDVCVQDVPVPSGFSAALAVECATTNALPEFTVRTI